MLIRDAEIAGVAPLDLRIGPAGILEIGRPLQRTRGEPTLHARGGALLPGLHDHHLHLFALAAARSSVRCGPPEVRDAHALERALRGAEPRGGWLRGVGYHESVAGPLDRHRLDALAPRRPLRIQHRSGRLWMLNSLGVERLGLDHRMGLDHRPDLVGLERDDRGRSTGRLFGLDAWLRSRLGPGSLPDLEAVSAHLSSLGVTGVTDATATNGKVELEAFRSATTRGELRQRVLVMGEPGLPDSDHPAVRRGPLKVHLAEATLPPFAELVSIIEGAHRQEDRTVAVHCVTRAELVFALAAFRSAGARWGDRIEHASVVPPELLDLLRTLPLTVVTQPGFVFERGDRYAEAVDARDQPWLYRGRGFLDAGIPLAAGTDAPFSSPDPWSAMRTAVSRKTADGRVIGDGEGLTPEEALALFTSPARAPGSIPRRVSVGAPADLCLLDRPWRAARKALSNACVRATLQDGKLAWARG